MHGLLPANAHAASHATMSKSSVRSDCYLFQLSLPSQLHVELFQASRSPDVNILVTAPYLNYSHQLQRLYAD
eukprot:5227340-Pleurochrysis_carterae.AAC.4